LRFLDIPGQVTSKKVLQNDFISGKVTHSYLFYGPDGSGKTQTALAFTQLLNCKNPANGEACQVCDSCLKISNLVYSDLILIYPDSKEITLKDIIDKRVENSFINIPIEVSAVIKIGQIKDLIKQIHLGNSEGKYKIIHIVHGEKMTVEASNALLKSLEEPPEGVIFIITCGKIENLLTTIVSRCRKVPFFPLAEEEFIRYFEKKQALIPFDERMFYYLAKGSIRKAFELIQQNLEFIEKQAYRIITSARNPEFHNVHQISGDFVKFSDSVKEIIIDILLYWFRLFMENSKLIPEEIRKTLEIRFSGLDKEKIVYALEYLDKMRFFIRRNFNLSLLFNQFLINMDELDKVTDLFD